VFHSSRTLNDLLRHYCHQKKSTHLFWVLLATSISHIGKNDNLIGFLLSKIAVAQIKNQIKSKILIVETLRVENLESDHR
jgi:hypothetical protein